MTTDTPQTAPVPVRVRNQSPGIILRVVWFVLVGWWLGQLALIAAWVLNVLVITLPLGLYLLNKLPAIITLRPTTTEWRSEVNGSGVAVITESDQPQRNLLLRAVYFVLVGWWFSLIWLEVAWLATATIVLLPLGFWMFAKSAAVTTLRKT